MFLATAPTIHQILPFQDWYQAAITKLGENAALVLGAVFAFLIVRRAMQWAEWIDQEPESRGSNPDEFVERAAWADAGDLQDQRDAYWRERRKIDGRREDLIEKYGGDGEVDEPQYWDGYGEVYVSRIEPEDRD